MQTFVLDFRNSIVRCTIGRRIMKISAALTVRNMMAGIEADSLIFEEVLEFLAGAPTAEEIVAFSPSEALQQRARYLLERNREGLLTPQERQELDDFARLNHFVSMLKARARARLTDT